MTTDTPQTDELFRRIWLFENEDEASDALCEMRDHARKLERENARLRTALEKIAAMADACPDVNSQTVVGLGSTVSLGSAVFEYDQFKLHACGTFTRNGKPTNWYKDQQTGKPWIPKKRKTFVSLVKQMVREGDFASA